MKYPKPNLTFNTSEFILMLATLRPFGIGCCSIIYTLQFRSAWFEIHGIR